MEGVKIISVLWLFLLVAGEGACLSQQTISLSKANGMENRDSIFAYFFRNGIKTPSETHPDKIVVYVSLGNLPGNAHSPVQPRKWREAASRFFNENGLRIYKCFLPDIDSFPSAKQPDYSVQLDKPSKPVVIQLPIPQSPFFNAFILQKADGSNFIPDDDEVLARMRQSPFVQIAGPCFLIEGMENEPHTYSGEVEIKFSPGADTVKIDHIIEQFHLSVMYKILISNNWYVHVKAPDGMGAGLNSLKEKLEKIPEIETVQVQNYFPPQ